MSDSQAQHGSRGGPPEGTQGGPAMVELPGAGRVAREALSWSFVRSAGPGGQNVNKRATKAVLRARIDGLGLSEPQRARLVHLAGSLATDAGEVIISSDSTRSQERNRDDCLRRLGDLVRRARTKPKTRRKTKPSKGAVQRRIDAKKQRGETKRRRRGPID
ncbi:MAG: aminoacyl-tRNA hydrolase [Phycisphaeraceae bacterium]|nr:MAG: aminoacyl-tRNA hydrolase [Phycisphaeraceae bacterium]